MATKTTKVRPAGFLDQTTSAIATTVITVVVGTLLAHYLERTWLARAETHLKVREAEHAARHGARS